MVRTSGVEGEVELDYAALQQLAGRSSSSPNVFQALSAMRSASRSGWAGGKAPSSFVVGLPFSAFLTSPSSSLLLCLVDDAQ